MNRDVIAETVRAFEGYIAHIPDSHAGCFVCRANERSLDEAVRAASRASA